MAIVIYNTFTRQKEEFVPREAGKVSMYVCGVTPYAPAHVGHGRSAVAFDVVRRWLTYRGYEVRYVVNVTDVEDKIIAASQREGRDWQEVAERYTASYLDELRGLGVLSPTVMPKASEHVGEIVELVEQLIETGHAYALDGDVAFHVPSYAGYGRLSRRDLDSQIAGARVEEDTRKRDSRDFFLWKAAKAGEPSWDSPWGPGRPGWHIECSAMSRKFLGEGFDIHGGGTDLLFPHHENEIAQSEACTGRPLARYWMHNGMLNIARGSDETEKMSKSLSNVIGLRETIGRVGGPALRYFYIAAHYRSDIPFSEEALEQAGSALERLRIARQTMDRLMERPTRASGGDLLDLAEARSTAEGEFHEAMDDDFSTPRALAALHGLVGAVNRAGAGAGVTFAPTELGLANLAAARETLVSLAEVLGLSLAETKAEKGLEGELIELLVEVRQKAREAGQYAIGDAVRARLAELGIVLEDHPEGTSWRRRR
ncbi:MAG: cysteine--tRNA ligase [Armatimonadetes bacterium]|nr:cysteine--tRNA ligase [Armatimonadota bacterium]